MPMGPKFTDRFWAQVRKCEADGCWEWLGPKNDEGYGRFHVFGKMLPAHRLAFDLEIGGVSQGLLVCHRCDNPSCVRPDHLFLGDNLSNAIDRMTKGRSRHLRHEEHPRARLNWENADKIRNDDRSHRVLAHIYGVSKSTIGRVKRGELWSR